MSTIAYPNIHMQQREMKRNFFILPDFWFSGLYNTPHRLLDHVSDHETLSFTEERTEDLETNWEIDGCIIGR